MREKQKQLALIVMLVAFGSIGVAAGDTPGRDELEGPGGLTTEEPDPGVIERDPAGDLDSGGEDWGYYTVSAAAPVDGLVRMGAHHATRWDSRPDQPGVEFDISTHEVDWDIADMGLEIKVDHVPGYKISVRVCARTYGNTGGDDGAIDTLTFSGTATSPEVQLATFDPGPAGGCKKVYLVNPVEVGADEYTIMVRPQVQIVQPAYWGYEIYDSVAVEYYPLLQP